ncbi:hypothetical protein D3C76_1578960 [compost metagenome]
MKDSIRKGDSILAPSFRMPPDLLMEPPAKLKPLKADKPTLRDLMISMVENYGICSQNAVRLESLQDLLKKYDAIYNFKSKPDSSK